ncbi:PREDICTED: uncharacterized protein LOC102772739 [Myotis davidii]|uniref:uncharacterized protein LOC102772739 n=1 Tax=Myotis davidii TaxID=225400 RepID=UPI0003EC63C5|nr:PREDICTED: uncharacterized protein LOC102772739 [Myotis davidii]
MVNKDMNGFPVKKCSAFQFFKKRVRRWIKNPMVSVDKHQSPSLKYTGPSVVHSPHGEPDLEPSVCRTCLGDHAFQRGVLPQEKESCPWETQPRCEVKEPCTHANILTKPDHRTFWTNDDSGIMGKMLSGPAMPRKCSVVKCCTETRLKGNLGSGSHSHPQCPEPHLLQPTELLSELTAGHLAKLPSEPWVGLKLLNSLPSAVISALNSRVRPPELAINFSASCLWVFGT